MNHTISEDQALDRLQVQILRALRAKSYTEKQLSKTIGLDVYPLSSIITDLMLLGYVDIIARRRFFFFTRRYCVITTAGLSALNRLASPIENIVGLIKGEALSILGSLFQQSSTLRLAGKSTKIAYGACRHLL